MGIEIIVLDDDSEYSDDSEEVIEDGEEDYDPREVEETYQYYFFDGLNNSRLMSSRARQILNKTNPVHANDIKKLSSAIGALDKLSSQVR